MDILKNILEKENKNAHVDGLKVNKLHDVECFLQDYVIQDNNEVNLIKIRSDDGEEYIQNISRDNMQIFVNKLMNLSTTKEGSEAFINLPDSPFPLPREKPVPVPKPLTKWEKFAKEKGLKKQKKPKTTWDDILQRWVPTYGYKRAAAEKEKDWLLEVPRNKDPNTDMFAEKKKLKKERVSKNEYQRLRNIAASKNIKVPKFGLPPLEGRMQIPQVKLAADIAKVSTASIGKFQPKLPHESTKNNFKGNKAKRKTLDSEAERKNNLSIADSVLKKKPKIDMTKAVSRSIRDDRIERVNEQKENKQSKKGKRKSFSQEAGGGNAPKKQKVSFKKPSSAKGKRVGKKQQRGRKRR